MTFQSIDPTEIKRMGMVKHLSPDQWNALMSIVEHIDVQPAGRIVNRRGNRLDHSLLLTEGLIARSIPRSGQRRSTFVALEFPGDFVDLHAFPLKRLDHDVVALTDCKLLVINHDRLHALIDAHTELGRMLWSLTLVDASIHRHWAMRNSSMRGLARVANFFCEFDARQAAVTGQHADIHKLGITQSDIADATGLSSVHVNRVLRDLREDGCCEVRPGALHILNRQKLVSRGAFDPAYLYLPGSDAVL